MSEEILIEVESPNYSYRYELAGNYFKALENERIERELLVKDEEFYKSLGFRKFRNGYSPSKYEILRIFTTYTVKFKGTQEQLDEFKKSISNLLKQGKAAITDEELEKQFDEIIIFFATFKPTWLESRFREWERKRNLNFYPKIAALLEIKDKVSENYPVKLRFATSTSKSESEKNATGNVKEYSLPTTDEGNSHLVAALTDFLLDYYSNNPPIKYIRGLPMDREALLSKARVMPTETEYLQKGLIENTHLLFHLDILKLIREFPQFKSPPNSILTNHQGRFILGLVNLLGYSKSRKNSMQVIESNFKDYTPSEDNIRELRNNLIALKKQLKKYKYYAF